MGVSSSAGAWSAWPILDCKLVEVPGSGLADLKLTFRPDEPASSESPREPSPMAPVDQAAWVVATVAFLMIGWGLVLMVAGLFSAPRSTTGQNPLGNGTGPFLGVGGAATAMFGMVLLVLATSRSDPPARSCSVSSAGSRSSSPWASSAMASTTTTRAVMSRSSWPATLAVFISAVAHRLERSQRQRALAALRDALETRLGRRLVVERPGAEEPELNGLDQVVFAAPSLVGFSRRAQG